MKLTHVDNQLVLTLSAFALLTFVVGCGGQKLPEGMPELSPVSITLTQEGKPLAGASVMLVNVDKTQQWSAIARTNDKGVAVPQTNGQYKGVPAGTYKVTVTKQETEKGPDPYADAPDPKVDQDKYQEWYMKNEAKIAAASRIPPKVTSLVDPIYDNVDKTTLSVTVEAKKKNEFPLDVGKAVSINVKVP